MDDKPGRLNQFRHQTKRRQSFASILPTDRFWPILLKKQVQRQPADSGLLRQAGP